jgi:hypothetical protein
LTLTSEGTPYPDDGDDLVTAAVVAYGATLGMGNDVIPAMASAYILGGYTDDTGYHEGVPGIRTIATLVKIGSAPAPTDINPIAVALSQVATTATANVVVTVP